MIPFVYLLFCMHIFETWFVSKNIEWKIHDKKLLAKKQQKNREQSKNH